MKVVFQCVLVVLMCWSVTPQMPLESRYWLTEEDYNLCDETLHQITEEEMKDGLDNYRYPDKEPWDSPVFKCHKNTIFKNTFKCCYVEFKAGNNYYHMCTFIRNENADIRNYKKRSLQKMDDVTVICSSKFIYIGSILALIVLLF